VKLRVDGLAGGYRPGVEVITGISLVVTGGSAIGVVGRNGAGKSALARSLMGLMLPTSGSVHLDDTDITALTPRKRIEHGLALVPEGRMIFGQLTVRENLTVAAYGAGRRLTTRKLKQIEDYFPILRTKAGDRAASLSGGEQQWLTIGRALAQEPTAIILDEPSLGLSPVAVEALAASLQQILDTGVGMLLMEQNPELLRRLCRDLLVLERGQIVRSHTGGADARELDLSDVFLGSGEMRQEPDPLPQG
jgi:ABC-type branched-subunit amino acid transport system ATPase component